MTIPLDPQWSVDPKLIMNCKDCIAECCKHIAVPVDAPTTWEDFQRIRHYVSHDGVTVYLDGDGDWLVEFLAKCDQLDGNRCKAWGTNGYPTICGEYDMASCIMNDPGDYWVTIFRTPADVDAYCAQHKITGTAMTGHPGPCVSVPIETPKDIKDFDDIRWYLAHRDVAVYRKGSAWFVHLHTFCTTDCQERAARNLLPTDCDEIFIDWESITSYCRMHPPLPNTDSKVTFLEP